MNQLIIAGAWGILGGLLALNVPPYLGLITTLFGAKPQVIKDAPWPKVAVILPLRGADPFLHDCLEALFNQNYPDYEVQIVIDSATDPAWNVVRSVLQRSPKIPVHVQTLTLRRNTCSLKGSSLIQAISALDNTFEVVAFIDADVIPHPDWLRELVTPLADPQIGATTGCRYYMPEQGQWGSLCRYLFSAAALVSMSIHRFPWGGTLAMKRSTLYQSQLLKIWEQTLSVDCPINKALESINLKVKFIPTLISCNREECSLIGCFRFIKRQFIGPRLYDPNWLQFVFHVITSSLAPLLPVILVITTLIQGQFGPAAWIGIALSIYILVMTFLLLLADQAMRHISKIRHEPASPISGLMVAKILLAIPITQLITGLALISSLLAKKVEWRGITYQIHGPWNIHLTEYHPYHSPPKSFSNNTSV